MSLMSTGHRHPHHQTTARLGTSPQVWDPVIRQELADIGVRLGQRILDAAAGAGHIVAHLADLVGPTGSVIAVDADTSLLDPSAIIDVYQRDLRTEPFPSAPASLDLAVARCLLAHLPNRESLLQQMIDLLRPGGWLVLGDVVYAPTRVYQAPTDGDAELISTVVHSILDALAADGVDLHWGDKAPGMLLAAGMNHVESQQHTHKWTGAGLGCALYAADARRLRDPLLAAGVTDAQLDRFAELMVDPTVIVGSYQFASIRAQKPWTCIADT